ncbi:MAG TPA: mechanosensitive ion channel family protein [Burkholderiales bacterium]|nr:mechanosensitive ion channel family protein [Burkholderiales bacterium]
MTWLRLCLIAGVLGALSGLACAADKKHASGSQLPEVPATLTPEQADAFLAKLTDAQARALLAHQLHASAEKRASAPPAAESGGLGSLVVRVAGELDSAQVDSDKRRAVVAQGTALLPAALASGAAQVFGGSAVLQLALLAAVLLAGAAASWAARRALRPHGLQPEVGADAKAVARVSTGALRFVLDLLTFAAFALVTLAFAHAFTGAGTPARTFVVAYVTGAILVSAGAVALRALLAPDSSPLRLVPLSEPGARFLYRWLLAVWALMVFASLSAELFIGAGAAREAQMMLTVIAGSAVGATLIAMIVAARPLVATGARLPALLAKTWPALAILYVLSVWLFWTAAVLDGKPARVGAAAASLGILLAFPLFDHWIGRAIDDLVGQSGSDSALRRHGAGQPLRWAMRVLLAVLLVSAANELWGFQVFEWQASLRHALLGASFDLIAAFAVAVLGWQFIKVAIDRRLEVHEVDGVRVEPSQRLRTLLPLARVFLVTALIATTVMLVLSGLGLNIGPLLAGAGILGLAIGFGAQTLVRDIITGVFLIMDDAFRVGEYIQSGNYKGTVESIGLRSVKLRHHRGPIYVVPFGELRGVQNLARDWVIHKFTIGITYDSDLEKARKLVKKIGQQLAEDPEYKDTILEPLKMQGVEEFGDFAIQVRMKMMTRPGDKQFGLKRKAHALIKKAFDANGIKFAFPTVQIAGGGGDVAVAAAATRLPAITGEQAA